MVFHLDIDWVLLLTVFVVGIVSGMNLFWLYFWGGPKQNILPQILFCIYILYIYIICIIYWEQYHFYFPVCSYLTNLFEALWSSEKMLGCLGSVQSCPTLCDPMDRSTPGFPVHRQLACSNSRPSSQWSHPTISSSAVPFSSCLQSFPASGYLLYFEIIYWMSWL